MLCFGTPYKILFCCLIVSQYVLSIKSSNADIKNDAIMFSARNSEEGKEGELFVVKNPDVFVRTIEDNVFHYSSPKDGTYSDPEIITDRVSGNCRTPADGDYAVIMIFHNQKEEGITP